jgi:hypothetical protein
LVDVKPQCLEALSQILPAYLSFNGVTDAWSRLYDALRNVQSLARYELTDEEVRKFSNLTSLATRVLIRESAAALPIAHVLLGQPAQSSSLRPALRFPQLADRLQP